MPLTSIVGEPGKQVLHYLRGPRDRSEIIWLRVTLLVTAVVGFISAVDGLDLAIALSTYVDELRDTMLEAPEAFAPEERDIFRLLSNVGTVGILIGLVVTFGIPLRYLVLFIRVGAASPNTWRGIRNVCYLALGMEVVKVLVTLIVSTDLEVLVVDYNGWGHLVLAGVLLWRIRRLRTRIHFSAHKVAKLPKDLQAEWQSISAPEPTSETDRGLDER